MERSFQVLLTNLLTSTCTFTFQHLSSHYVVGIRLFYIAPVRNTVKICNSWLLPHIIIQPLTPISNLAKVNTVPFMFTTLSFSDSEYMTRLV